MIYIKNIALIGLLILASAFSFPSHGVKVGDSAPDFSLKAVDGSVVSLKSNKSAQGYILVFTCNTCPYSTLYEDRIIDLHQKYLEQGFSVIAIQPNNPEKSSGDSFAAMKERANKKDFPFPYAIDTDDQATTAAYGATNTPHVYVLEKVGGDFKVAYIGAIDNNSRNPKAATRKYVEEAVDALVSGGNVDPNSTKAIGCTIK